MTASFTVNVSDANAASDSGNANPEEDVDIYCLGGGRPIAIISGPSPDSFTQAGSTGAQTGDIAHGTTATWNTSLSSELDGDGVSTGSVTVTFARRLTDGSTTQQQTVTVTTNSVTISLGSLGPNPTAEGDDASVTWSSNYNGTLYYNSTTGGFTSQSGQLGSGGSGTLTLTADSVDQPEGESVARVTARYGGTSGDIKDTSNDIILYRPVVAPTPSISITSNNQTDGSFVFTCGESGGTTNTESTTEYRFLDESNNIEQLFSTDNTYNGTGSERPLTLKAQIREKGLHNTSVSGTTGTLTVSQIPADTTFTASSPTIAWDATSFTTTLTGVQIGDEVRAVLTSNTGILFENFTTVTSTTFNLVCNNATVNSTNLPNGTATSVRIQVKRPTSVGGDDNTSNATTFNVTRNYRTGPFANVTARVGSPLGASSTIGAQKYNAYDIGGSEPVIVTGSGVISGATYIGRIVSGTTQGGATQGIVYSQVASGTEPNAATTAGGCSFSQLPTPGNTCGYRITCIIPTSLGGDGSTEHECTALSVYVPGNETEWTITRSNYVQPDTSVSSSTSATAVDVDLRSYQFGASSTSETISYTGGSAVTQYRILEVVGSVEVDTNTGASGTLTIDNANLPTAGNNKVYWLQARVQTVDDGTGTWVNTDDTQYSGLEYVYQLTRETLATPTAGILSAYRNNANGAEIVPSLALTWNGGTGEVEYAFSTTNTTPTNWTGTGYVDNGNSSLSRVTGPGTARSATALYMGVRQKSVIDGTTTTPSYSSNTGGPFYNELTGNTFIEITYNGTVYYPGSGQTPILVPSTDNTNNAVVSGFSKQAYSETSIDANSVGEGASSNIQTVTNYSSFEITTDAANTNVGPAGTVVASDTVNSAGNPSLVISNPSEMPASGDGTLEYTLYEYIFTARGGRGTKVATIPAIENQISIRKRAPVDGDITVTGVRQTLANNHSTDLVLTIADGNSTTQYRLYSQGADYDARVGNGTLTATNPGDLPSAGTSYIRNYRIQYREAGTSDNYQDATGTGTNFNLGRLTAMDLGTLSNPVSVEATTSSAVITLSGAVGNITALLTKNSGGGTVRLSKNGQTFANSTASGTSITVVDGDTLQVLAETPTTYSNTTQSTLTLTQDSVTIFSDTFSFTTESSPGGSTGGGGGTGNYGLEIRDSSNNIILTNSDRVGDFCYATSVTVASGASTGVSTSQTPGGNVVIIEDNLNPFYEDDRVSASLENNGTQVRINMLGVAASTTLTFNVLVFNV